MIQSRSTFHAIFSILILGFGPKASLADKVTLIGRTSISATATDLSGLTDVQENGTPQNRFGGQGSGICWMGKENRYVMLPDRGPDDGATSYRCRVQIVEIKVDPAQVIPVTTRLLETHLLTTNSGANFVGRSSQFDQNHPERSLRFDPEGIRVTSRGTLLISDEYGPTIREFDVKGKWIRDLSTPGHYLIAKPGATPEAEMPPHNKSGRQSNRGWEGIGLSVDGSKVYAITQSPLIQDGGLDEKNARVGTNIRLLEKDLATDSHREFLYPLEDKALGCSDVEAIAPDRLLVIERDSKPGAMAKFKRIYEIDLTNASDISSIDHLPATGTPANAHPVAKKLLIDLLAPEFGLAGETFPEKIEGIALGPLMSDGSRVLIVTSDNDFKTDEPTEIFAFRIGS